LCLATLGAIIALQPDEYLSLTRKLCVTGSSSLLRQLSFQVAFSRTGDARLPRLDVLYVELPCMLGFLLTLLAIRTVKARARFKQSCSWIEILERGRFHDLVSQAHSGINHQPITTSTGSASASEPDPTSAAGHAPASEIINPEVRATSDEHQANDAASLVSSDDFAIAASPPNDAELRSHLLARTPPGILNQNGWIGWEAGAHERQILYHSHRIWGRLRLLFIGREDCGSPLSRLDAGVIWHLAIRVLCASLSDLKLTIVNSPSAPWRRMHAQAARSPSAHSATAHRIV